LILDVELLSNLIIIEVIKDGTTIDAGRNLLQVSMVVSLLAAEVSVLGSSEGTLSILIAFSENIILIDEGNLFLEFMIGIVAHTSKYRWDRGIDVGEIAVVRSEVIINTITNQAMVISHVEISGVAIVFPVGHTVADHEALEVGLPLTRLGAGDIHVKSQSELRNVDPSIRLARNKQLIVLKSSKLILKKGKHCGQVIISRVVIIEIAFAQVSTDGISYSGRCLDVYHVSIIVP